MFWSKKDTLLRKHELIFKGYRRLLSRSETILKEQDLERKISDVSYVWI
jgi:hypothetical protein